jgi:hypothetical protein
LGRVIDSGSNAIGIESMTKIKPLLLAVATLNLPVPTSNAADCGNTSVPKAAIVEIVTFKLNAGISDTDFLAKVSEMEQAFLCKEAGFVRRTLSKNEDGSWFDYVEWASLKEASNAMENSMTDQRAAAFIQSIAPASVAVQHWQIVSQTK